MTLDQLGLIQTKKIYIEDNNASSYMMENMVMFSTYKATLHKKNMVIKTVSPKNVIKSFQEMKDHPIDALINTANNFFTVEGLASLTVDILSGSLGVVALLRETINSAVKEINEFDTVAVVLSLVNTEYSSFGLNKNTLLDDANLLIERKNKYSISMEKLNYILEQLINNFELVIEENNLIYLANEVKVK